MTFGFPLVLLLLLLIPAILFLRRRGWGRPATVLYPEAESVKAVFQGGRRPGSGLREKLRLAAVMVLIIAAARPQQIQSVQRLSASGLDIMLALDISGSMSARDFEPQNRLQAAKEELKRFLAKENENRLGLIAFAAQAFTVCPLTLDYHVLLNLLDYLQIGMTSDGTAIGMAIATAANRLKHSEAKAKVIILLTDGKNNAGRLDPLTAAEVAAALDMRIYTIGMGQPGGAPILVKNSAGEKTLLLKADGSVYFEEMDEETLIKIADITGGKYFRAIDKNKLREIYAEIHMLEHSRLHSEKYTSKRDVGYIFIFLAVLLLAIEVLIVRMLHRRLPA
ncbi:VWA domain-containing protein [bacterium]|nr:VWA domain-containing protein [bacterium]